MMSADKMKHMAYCGFDCGKCPLFADSVGDTAQCHGCKSELASIHPFCAECSYRLCARERGFGSCGECPEYPCREITSNSALSKNSIAVLDSIHRDIFG